MSRAAPTTAKQQRPRPKARRPAHRDAPRDPPPQRRREPQQERSRDRVDAILEAARRLSGDRSNDDVSMRDIAAEAGVPISSIYQYFPDKSAILRELMTGYLAGVQAELAVLLDRATSVPELRGALGDLVDVMVRTFRERREFATIWAAVQANTKLRELDAADGRRMAEFLRARFQAIAPGADPAGVRAACLHAVHTVGTTVRVATLYSTPEDGAMLIAEFKTLLRLRFDSLVE